MVEPLPLSDAPPDEDVPILSAEVLTIALEKGRYIIYAPLRRAAFVANARVGNGPRVATEQKTRLRADRRLQGRQEEMIQSERQYKVTKKKLAALQQAQALAEKTPTPELPPRAQRAGINGMRALIGDLRAELDEYEKLEAGAVRALPLEAVLSDLPGAWGGRASRGWTHKDYKGGI